MNVKQIWDLEVLFFWVFVFFVRLEVRFFVESEEEEWWGQRYKEYRDYLLQVKRLMVNRIDKYNK